MDRKISFAPIYGTSPTKILELGWVLRFQLLRNISSETKLRKWSMVRPDAEIPYLYPNQVPRAIAAATDFPESEVIAVDMSPTLQE
jgi:hypothetical protein